MLVREPGLFLFLSFFSLYDYPALRHFVTDKSAYRVLVIRKSGCYNTSTRYQPPISHYIRSAHAERIHDIRETRNSSSQGGR